MPKVPPAKKRARGGGGGGAIRDNYSENLALDLSDDSDETETLGMDKVYAVYSTHGRQLGSCLMSNGGGSANIGIIINMGVDANGQPLDGLTLKSEVVRPATETGKRELAFQPAGDGSYRAALAGLTGAWDLAAVATDARGRTFEVERRIVMP